MPNITEDLKNIRVLIASFKRRYSGVTSTVLALKDHFEYRKDVAYVGYWLPRTWKKISLFHLIVWGRQPPTGSRFRVWHARRNNEMLIGVILKHVARLPLRLLFTSAAQRRHTAYTRYLLRKMDAVIATSEPAAAYLEVPYQIVMHGIDTDLYRPESKESGKENPPSVEQLRKLPESCQYGIGVFGRVRMNKGTDIFVDVVCKLLPHYPQFYAIIVGMIKPGEARFAGQLQSRIDEAGLSDRVLILGEQSPENVRKLMRKMLIVVGPQRQEGFGLVPLEAMASGVAVLATRVGAAAFVVPEGLSGYLVEPEDEYAMEEKLRIMMEDVAATKRMGVYGRGHVERHHSIQSEAANISAIYDKLLEIKIGE